MFKKTIFALALSLAALAGAHARQTVGGTLDFSSDPGAVGIGARYTYAWDNLRLAPDLKLLFPDAGTEFDLNANVHYTVAVVPKFTFYPLAGLSLARYSVSVPGTSFNISDTFFGLNVGVGGEYEFTPSMIGFAELKGVLGDGSRAQFSVGVAYRF